MTLMIGIRFLILFYILYISRSVFGITFSNPELELSGWSLWFHELFISSAIAMLFAILWGFKTAFDVQFKNENNGKS